MKAALALLLYQAVSLDEEHQESSRRERSRSPVPPSQTGRRKDGKFPKRRTPPPSQDPVEPSSSSEPRECRWIRIISPSIKDTNWLNERLWWCAALCSPHITWMATNWMEEDESDVEEDEAAAVAAAASDEEDEQQEDEEEGEGRSSRRTTPSSSSSSSRLEGESSSRTKKVRKVTKLKQSTCSRTFRRRERKDAHSILYFSAPVNIQLLRQQVQDSISGCLVSPVIRGQGIGIRRQIGLVLATGTGLSTKGDGSSTPHVQLSIKP